MLPWRRAATWRAAMRVQPSACGYDTDNAKNVAPKRINGLTFYGNGLPEGL